MWWHNPNLLCQAEIVLFVRFLLFYIRLVFALFLATLSNHSYPALYGYEQTCRFLPFPRHPWPSLAPSGQMFTPTQERAVLRVRARHASMSKICPGYVQERSFLRACATGKTRWVFLLVRGPWWTSPHTAWALASSGQRWSPLSCPSWGYHHGCFAPRCYRMSRPLSAHR